MDSGSLWDGCLSPLRALGLDSTGHCALCPRGKRWSKVRHVDAFRWKHGDYQRQPSVFFLTLPERSVAWGASSSDLYVYYPSNMPKWKSFVMTLTGLTLSFSFVYLLGVGLATGIAGNESWATAYDTSSGALILAGYDGLGGFGKFCDVIVALGVIANNIPGTYAAALNVQVLGRYG
jgi:hypothetical protein